jgi:hypothetical protein
MSLTPWGVYRFKGQGAAMRLFSSYIRLFMASWLFLGGIALQFVPSPAAVARNDRWRERQLQAVPADERPRWIEERDLEDGRTQAYVRLLGVLIGGGGFAGALRETAYLVGKYSRQLATTNACRTASTRENRKLAEPRLACGAEAKSAVAGAFGVVATTESSCWAVAVTRRGRLQGAD